MKTQYSITTGPREVGGNIGKRIGCSLAMLAAVLCVASLPCAADTRETPHPDQVIIDSPFQSSESDLEIAAVQREGERAQTGVRRPAGEPEKARVYNEMAQEGASMYGTADRLHSIVRRAPSGGKSLVIQSSEPDAKEQKGLEEDLAVMSRILDKAMEEELGREQLVRKAMGIDVMFAPGGGEVRNLFLEDYGALFFLKVGFPLLEASSKAPEQKEEEPVNSDWEEAKRELYGQPSEAIWVAPPAEKYDAEKVNKLRDAVLKALKNANNIRSLKADDSITVCIFGSTGSPWRLRVGNKNNTFKRAPVPGDEPNEFDVRFHDGASRGTIMTIRVRKSDAEAFGNGKLSLEDFRNKARINTYVSDVGGEGSGLFGFGGSRVWTPTR